MKIRKVFIINIRLTNLILIKNAGEVKINDKFCLNVLSVFDEENWSEPTDYNLINIALYHGAIDKSKTDSNWTLGGDHSIEIFEEFDFGFLGDIHKTQKLDCSHSLRSCSHNVSFVLSFLCTT